MTIHEVGEIYQVEQRDTDGFINGTAMCVAHGKQVKEWFKNQSALELIDALAESLGIKSNRENSTISSVTRVSEVYYGLIFVKQGAPANGGGVWLHPDLAIQLAQWCSPKFALQVSQ